MTNPQNPDYREQASLLSWLHQVADTHSAGEVFGPVAVPVAWVGRTSTDDMQDPTLSLPRQLGNSRQALPDGFVIVAHFYDVESGRAAMELRGHGEAHQQFDIPIPRDGGIADLLVEAKRPDGGSSRWCASRSNASPGPPTSVPRLSTSWSSPGSCCSPRTRASTGPPSRRWRSVPNR